jgi:hypothetical protein
MDSARRDGPLLLLPPTELRPSRSGRGCSRQIALSRQQDHHRNLFVSATSTSKTVMAALDYARLREGLSRGGCCSWHIARRSSRASTPRALYTCRRSHFDLVVVVEFRHAAVSS